MLSIDDALAAVDRLYEDGDIESLMQIDSDSTWAPLPGPQLDAWESPADELFYGGAAGGGKTDFILGLALEQHQNSVIYRRESTQLTGITDRLSTLLGGRDQYHGSDKVWRLGGRQIEYGSMPHPGDEQRQQGRPRDLLVFDEITQFSRHMYRYLLTWNRSTDPNQRCRVVATGNPPTTPEGLWVLQDWAPWLDEEHPLYGTVQPGELLWYISEGGRDKWVTSPEPMYQEATGLWVTPRSRSFIPAVIEDNPFLLRTGYANTLEGLPEPLRSQMRHGDFSAGQDDDEWQVIPSEWVRNAQRRWHAREHDPHGPMSAMGVDCARGGKDQMVCIPRHGSWFAKPHTVPGHAVPDGPSGAAVVVQHARNACELNIDVVGVGSSVVDHLEGLGLAVNSLNGAARAWKTDRTGRLKMHNLRAQLYWSMRELLDPSNPDPIALPPGGEVRGDLCAPRYRVGPQGVLVESKEDLMRRLGRSPDIGDAIVYAAHGYESRGLLAQNVLRAQKDGHFDGPYTREQTLRERTSGAYLGFSDVIDYGD